MPQKQKKRTLKKLPAVGTPDKQNLAIWRRLIQQPYFPGYYLIFSVVVLLLTTLYWATLSAHLQTINADQVVNAFLFEHSSTFKNAALPGQHTFLFKWPLFWLVHLGGYSVRAFTTVTVATVLATVGGFVFIISRIERRPLILGTLCLALASVLLLVPPMPYAGGLLPVNMAMLATRNLEYIFFIVAIGLLLKAKRLRSWYFASAVIVLGLLIASDKLFLTLALGGGLMALLVYALKQGWQLVNLNARWVVHGLLGSASAVVILTALDRLHVTHIIASGNSAPYLLVQNIHDLTRGSLFGLLGLLTNFGANPAYDVFAFRSIPHAAFSRLLSTSGPAYLVNAIILAAGLWTSWWVLRSSLRKKQPKNKQLAIGGRLTLILLWSSLAAFIAFLATNHYYAVDSRYLSIALFAVFMAMANYCTTRIWSTEKIVGAGLLLTVSVLAGMAGFQKTYHAQAKALTTVDERNNLISQVLSQHHVDLLVGDYWRVLPTKLQAPHLNVLPLDSCTQARTLLSSSSWQPDLSKHSFAYLLSFDGSLTGYPPCSLDQIIAQYGRPNSSALIAGTFDHPREQLLFFDNGAHRSEPQRKTSTVLPITPDELPNTMCDGPTDMNIVAHQDDDLLFMNPDINQAIKAGHCQRTVYLTAGDAGNGQFYWLSREHGSEAAYSIAGNTAQEIWIERVVKLSDSAYVTIASPRGKPSITLIFMHLPDGNADGTGFKASRFESLKSLEEQRGAIVHSVDKQSVYTSDKLTNTLVKLMALYQPALIRTQANYSSQHYTDHADHRAVGRYAQKAYQLYETEHYENRVSIPMHFYLGYPVHELPANVSGDELNQKEAAFFAYGSFDRGVCGSLQQCNAGTAYGSYLPRQYHLDQ